MTNEQLYLAIGVPIVFNVGLIIGLYTVLTKHMDTQFSSMLKYMDTRFTTVDNNLKK